MQEGRIDSLILSSQISSSELPVSQRKSDKFDHFEAGLIIGYIVCYLDLKTALKLLAVNNKTRQKLSKQIIFYQIICQKLCQSFCALDPVEDKVKKVFGSIKIESEGKPRFILQIRSLLLIASKMCAAKTTALMHVSPQIAELLDAPHQKTGSSPIAVLSDRDVSSYCHLLYDDVLVIKFLDAISPPFEPLQRYRSEFPSDHIFRLLSYLELKKLQAISLATDQLLNDSIALHSQTEKSKADFAAASYLVRTFALYCDAFSAILDILAD